MGPRPANTQLDLSASSFPSLNNGGLQSQSQNVGSSAWQTGPPQNEQAQRQQMQSTRSHISSRQQQPATSRDGFYPTDTYSRNAPMEFSPDTSSQPVRRASQAPGGPPGLTQRQPNQGDSTPQDPSRVTSPSGQTQICMSHSVPDSMLADVKCSSIPGISEHQCCHRAREILRAGWEITATGVLATIAGVAVAGHVW